MSVGSKPTGTTTTNDNKNTLTNTITNQTTSPPPWYLNAWQSVLGQGQDLYNNLPYTTAGMMPDQMLASLLANAGIQGYMQRPGAGISSYDVFGMGNQWDTGVPQIAGPGQATTGVASVATPASMKAAQLSPNDIAPFMNPYIQNVANPTATRLRNQELEMQANIAGRGAAQNMLGGSQAAIASALADRDYRQQLSESIGNLLNTGWNSAAGLAGANTDREQAARSLNAQLENTINALNAQLGTQVSMGNAQIGGQLANTALGANANLLGQYQNNRFSGAQNDATRFLQAISQQSNVDNNNLMALMNALGGLNQFGTQQQSTAQKGLDSYWQQLGLLAQLLNGNPGQVINSSSTANQNQTGTSVTDTSKPIDLGSTLLGALGLAGRLGLGR